MKITKVRVEGFRLLQDVEVSIEAMSTVVVGRNNSGKTSLTEIFERFLGDRPGSFRLEDFSSGTLPQSRCTSVVAKSTPR